MLLLTVQNVFAVDVSPPNYGRYQLSSWSTHIDDDTAAVGAFIIDTATGETRTAFIRLIDKSGKGLVIKNDLKKPFHAIE